MNGVSESVSGSVKIDTTDILAYSITPYRLMVVLSVSCRNCGACGNDGEFDTAHGNS